MHMHTKARAVLVDMEEGVINGIRNGDLKELFDPGGQQFVTAPSGCGNNWAHGFHESGPRYRDRIMNRIRSLLKWLGEMCWCGRADTSELSFSTWANVRTHCAPILFHAQVPNREVCAFAVILSLALSGRRHWFWSRHFPRTRTQGAFVWW